MNLFINFTMIYFIDDICQAIYCWGNTLWHKVHTRVGFKNRHRPTLQLHGTQTEKGDCPHMFSCSYFRKRKAGRLS